MGWHVRFSSSITNQVWCGSASCMACHKWASGVSATSYVDCMLLQLYLCTCICGLWQAPWALKGLKTATEQQTTNASCRHQLHREVTENASPHVQMHTPACGLPLQCNCCQYASMYLGSIWKVCKQCMSEYTLTMPPPFPPHPTLALPPTPSGTPKSTAAQARADIDDIALSHPSSMCKDNDFRMLQASTFLPTRLDVIAHWDHCSMHTCAGNQEQHCALALAPAAAAVAAASINSCMI
jgi:hypothetical protein